MGIGNRGCEVDGVSGNFELVKMYFRPETDPSTSINILKCIAQSMAPAQMEGGLRSTKKQATKRNNDVNAAFMKLSLDLVLDCQKLADLSSRTGHALNSSTCLTIAMMDVKLWSIHQ